MTPRSTVNRSYLDFDCPPTIGIDPGSLYCAGVAREGNQALDGFVVALKPGEVINDDQRAALPLNDLGMWIDFHRRACDAVEQLWQLVWPGRDDVRLAIEGYLMPESNPEQPRRRVKRWIPLSDSLPVREQVAALCGRFPGAYVIPRDNFGGRHQLDRGGPGGRDAWQLYYPPPLVGTRPAEWMTSERGRGHPRIDEQVCYDVAGECERWLASEAESLAAVSA